MTNAVEQFAVHILGVAIAVVFSYFIGVGPLVMGLGVMILIVICTKINQKNAISLGVVSIIFVLDSPPDQFLSHVFLRSLSVIIGLGVALVINILLFPPKNKGKLLKKMVDLYNQSADYFFKSLHTFINAHEYTDYHSIEPVQLIEKERQILQLMEDAWEELKQEDNPIFIERFYELSRGFIERGKKIDEMTVLRVKRRNDPKNSYFNNNISPEFISILDSLTKGEEILKDLRRKLSSTFTEKKTYEMMKIDEDYWQELSKVIDVWQDRFTGVYYLRSLMEISVVATEMSWAGRRMKGLINLNNHTPQGGLMDRRDEPSF